MKQPREEPPSHTKPAAEIKPLSDRAGQVERARGQLETELSTPTAISDPLNSPGDSLSPQAGTQSQEASQSPEREDEGQDRGAADSPTPLAQSQRYILIEIGLLLAIGAVAAYGIFSHDSSPGPSPVEPDRAAAPAPAPKPQPIAGPAKTITGKDDAPMVLVLAGEFMMGSREDDKSAQNDERPAHSVYLDAFYIDQYEVTTSRYAKFFRETKRSAPEYWPEQVMQQHGRKPVVGVDWNDATAYCSWAGKRLPTEAEWEKAARGTDQRVYPWGNAGPSKALANFDRCCDFKDYGALTDIGSFEEGKSPFGVYDMAGNVWEGGGLV